MALNPKIPVLESGSVIPFDQDEINGTMKKILNDLGITDVKYPGSNISQLSAVISYVVSSLNVNTAINLQETLLPLATKRMNVQFGARQLGYEPRARVSYKYKLTIIPQYNMINPVEDTTGKLVPNVTDTTKIPYTLLKNTVFKSGDKTYYYKGANITPWNISNYDIINNLYTPLEIEVTEGVLYSYENDPTLRYTPEAYLNEDGNYDVYQDFLIPIENVEDDGIEIIIETESDVINPITGQPDLIQTIRTKSEKLLIDENLDYDKDKFIRMENIILGYPVVFFEYANFGNPIKHGDNVYANVYTSSGADGEAVTDFSIVDGTVASYFKVDSSDLISKGYSEESIESIKQNAIVFNNTANRAVTKLDYLAISSAHQDIKESSVWGGEEEDPQVLGNIWLSTVPNYEKNYTYTAPGVEDESYELDIGTADSTNDIDNLNNWYQNSDTIAAIIEYLDYYKVMTMQLNHRHPLYVNFDYEVDIIKYDLVKSNTTVNKEVFDAINFYFENYIETYEAEYLNSNLQRIADISLSYNSGVNYSVNITGSICRTMFDSYYQDSLSENIVFCSLGFPFENLYDSNDNIITTNLPNIDTTETFGVGLGSIAVDYSSFTLTGTDAKESVDIVYTNNAGDTDTVIGSYTVNNKTNTIDLSFNFTDAEGITAGITDEIFGVSGTNEDYANFNISYPYSDGHTQNVPFVKNTIPRLKKVSFKNN